MGLTIAVGMLAQDAREVDAGELAELRKPYVQLNDLLLESGLAPHEEPLTISTEERFEAEMGGYSALHTVRRLAAHLALRSDLPPPGPMEDASDDPVLKELYDLHANYDGQAAPGLMARMLGARLAIPAFRHLLCHSDCEGFYLPRDLSDVVFDDGPQPREGLGYMVGSSIRLLEECNQLAAAIGLPPDLDPEADELYDLFEEPNLDGPLWQRHGVEAFCLVRLINGCKRSIATGGALVFT